MAFFAAPSTTHNQFLAAPSAPSRKKSQRFLHSHEDIDDFLSSDLEISFSANVSLNSPPREHHMPSSMAMSHDSDSGCGVPMDISPAPPIKRVSSRLDMGFHGESAKQRPRAFTSGARLFGSDLSNNTGKTLLPSPHLLGSVASRPQLATQSSSKKIQRSALPTEWFAPPRAPEPELPIAPSSPMDDAMDVDTSYNIEPSPSPLAPVSFSPEPQSAAPTITGFNQLFYDTLSPRRSYESPVGPLPKKRRSLSPESARRTTGTSVHHHHHEESSSPMPMMHSSPTEAKLERIASGTVGAAVGSSRNGKPSLQGLGNAPSANFLKRPRRPVLSAIVQPSEHNIHSAYPILSPPSTADNSPPFSEFTDDSPRGSAPVRRAFSAFLPPSIYTAPEAEADDEESESFDGPSDMSSPAQAYSKRQQVKTIRRCDGTEDFRPLTGATALTMRDMGMGGMTVPGKGDSPSAKFMAAQGLPGFGDNEKHGKILPCHRVTEDGLMRIKPQTLDDLLEGKFNDEITDFHIIDCRFDYEYNGGHIPGAVNINNTTGVEELLLGPSLTKPRPSVSGDKARKTILVFHCEFSAKRAPTFAKHLRAKDRAMNNHLYPKIHYPEVYILEGGYCHYFKVSGHRCEPPAYVTMDDPNHAMSRREDLDQFRKAKFGRHKSYAYGDGKSLPFGSGQLSQQQQPQQPKRNTAPSGGPLSLFAAATAARSRRSGITSGVGPSGGSLMTLVEDGGHGATDGDDTDVDDTDLGDSPCPPPTKATAFKGLKKMPGRGMVRAETYGPIRMPY